MSLNGCRTSDPALDQNQRLTDLEEKVTRLEEQLARLRDQMETPLSTPGPTDPALAKTYRRITSKAGGGGRLYRTNGGIITVKTAGGENNGFSFEKPDVLRVAGQPVKLADLSLCAAPGKNATLPPEVDLLVAPDNRLAWLVVACGAGGDVLYLVDLEKARLLQTEFSGPAAPTTSTLWSPDAAFMLMETCKGVCDLTLLDTTGNKLDLTVPDLFGYIPPDQEGAKDHPKCRISGGDWTGVAVARLKLACGRKAGQAPTKESETELVMAADLNVLERTLSVVVQ